MIFMPWPYPCVDFAVPVESSSNNSKAERDNNGSLLCQKCIGPYPYAEPKEDGTFICYDCSVEM